jgi:glycosyltransferase involved in cell wall biosynthesis
MKVLTIHNRYRNRGGEDAVFETESRMLRACGVDVKQLLFGPLDETGPIQLAASALSGLWSQSSYREVARICDEWLPDVVHVHNLFVSASPSVLHACSRRGVAVVMTLHNYRQTCVNGILFRDGRTCVDCLGKPASIAGTIHGCYRQSRLQSLAMTSIIGLHTLIGTWRDHIDHYIALSSFSRDIFLTAGLPADRISVKPNFIDIDPGAGDGTGFYALFAGRLTDYKGIGVLLDAWRTLRAQMPNEAAHGASSWKLKIAGSGPMESAVRQCAAEDPSVEYLGQLDTEQAREAMKSARFLVFPSINFENFPMVIVEAFSTGLPVVASRIGGLETIVRHRQNGLLFDYGDQLRLAASMKLLFLMPQRELETMRATARGDYFERYTSEANLQKLTSIYERAIAHRQGMELPETEHTYLQ